MADVIGEGVIELTGDPSGFERSVATVVASADKTGKAVTSGFASEFNKVSAAAGALSAQVGGAFGKIGSIANAAIRPLAQVASSFGAIGASAAGVAAGAVAIGALAAAAKGLADGAVGASDRLDDVGLAVSGEAKADIESYRAAMRDLGIAIDQVKVAAGSEVAGELAILARTVAANTGAAVDFVREASEVSAELFRWVTFGSAAVVELGAGGLYDTLTADTRAASEAAGAMREYTTELAAASAAAAKLNNELEKEAQEDVAAGRAEVRRQETEAIRAMAAAEKEAAAQHQTVMDARIAGWQASADAAQAAADVESAASQAVRDQLLADNQAVLDSTDEILQRRTDNAQAWEDQLSARSAQEVAILGEATLQILGQLDRIAQNALSGYDARIAGGEELSRAEVRAANAAQDLAEAAAITMAGIQATLSGMGMITALAPYMGPYAIPVGVGIAAGLFAASTAAIVSGQPFNYHYGANDAPPVAFVDTTGEGVADTASPVADKGGSVAGSSDRPGGGAGATARGGGSHVTVGIDNRTKRMTFTTGTLGKRTVR